MIRCYNDFIYLNSNHSGEVAEVTTERAKKTFDSAYIGTTVYTTEPAELCFSHSLFPCPLETGMTIKDFGMTLKIFCKLNTLSSYSYLAAMPTSMEQFMSLLLLTPVKRYYSQQSCTFIQRVYWK